MDPIDMLLDPTVKGILIVRNEDSMPQLLCSFNAESSNIKWIVTVRVYITTYFQGAGVHSL